MMKNDCNKTIEAEYKQSLPAKLSFKKFAYMLFEAKNWQTTFLKYILAFIRTTVVPTVLNIFYYSIAYT